MNLYFFSPYITRKVNKFRPTIFRIRISTEFIMNSNIIFYLAKHKKATGQITTAQFKERVVRGMFYAESAIDCLKNDPKNANMNLDNFSIHC